MPASHHPPTDALWAYAAGRARPSEELLVACHLTVCPACRREVELADAGAAALAFTAPDADVPPLDAVLGRLDAPLSAGPPPESGAGPGRPGPARVPRPFLLRHGPPDALRWRKLPKGDIRVARLGTDRSDRAFVLDFPAGSRVPAHTHEGVERALVLSGGFTIEGGATYLPGDVSWTSDPHGRVAIHDDARCLTLFVNDGPMWTGRPIADRVLDWLLLR